MEPTRTRMGFRRTGERGAYILVVRDDSSFVHHLPHEGAVTIGRAPDVELRLSDRGVSARHAEIVVLGGRVFVQDRGSTNGTRVNGRRIDRAPLQPGDLVTVAAVTMVLPFLAYPMTHSRALFDDDFRRAFLETYRRTGSTESFDVWQCD